MKKINKLLLTLLLVLLTAALVAVGLSAAAEDPTVVASGYCGGEGDGTNLTWTLDSEGLLTISGEGKMADYYSVFLYNSPWTDRKDDVKTIVIENGVTTIAAYAFQKCVFLTQITIPDSVTSIGFLAFQNCTSLTEVVIPNSINSIGSSAFQGCTSLTRVVLSDSVTGISSSTFSGCTALTSVEIPNTVTHIYERAFEGCSALPSITLPTGLTSLGDYAFLNCTLLTGIDIPDGVVSIGKYAFYGCTALASITVPDNITNVGSDIMTNTAWFNAQADGLVYLGKVAYTYKGEMPEQTTLVLNDTCKAIAGRAFIARTEITSVVISENVKTVGESAFSQCTGLMDLTIENGVESIEEEAFVGCSSLKSVTIPQSVTSIGTYGEPFSVFSNCSSMTEFIVDSNNPNYANDDAGCLYDKEKKTLFIYPIGKPETSFTIPAGVTTISTGAFYECQNLTSLIIPEGVTWIDDLAFVGMRLTSITIPNGVTGIGENAFVYCSQLSSITLPDSVTWIGDWAFAQCSALTDVFYTGTEEQWNRIGIGQRENEYLRNANRYYFGQDWGYCGPYGNRESATWMLYHDGTMVIRGTGTLSSEGFSSIVFTDAVEKVIIEDGITTLEACALAGVPMKTVELAASVESIWNSAFMNCPRLESIVFLNPDVTLECGDNSLPYWDNGDGPAISYNTMLYGYLGSTVAALEKNHGLGWPFTALCPTDYTHTVVEKADTAPACATKWYCVDCGKYLIDPTAAAGEHTLAPPVRENEIAATCTAAGSYTEVLTCTACGNEVSRTAVTVAPLNHKNAYSVAATEATATAHGYTAGTYCPDCETWLSGHDVIHNHLGAQTIIKAPTDTEEGLVEIVCTVCGESGVYTASKTEPKPTDDGGDSGDSSGGFWQKIQTFTKGVIKWFLQLFKWLGKK